jgi:hypothetical protein
MDESRVVSIGWPSYFNDIELLSATNLSEFDTIIWVPQRLLRLLYGNGPLAMLHEVKYAEQRLHQLESWVSEGHSLIVIMNSVYPIAFDGSALPFKLEQNFPLNLITLADKSGSRVECCGPSAANDALEKFCFELNYEVILDGGNLKPLLQVGLARSGPEQIIGGYVRHGRGLVVFVPPLVSNLVPIKNDYAVALATLPDLLTANQPLERPEWVGELWTATETAAHQLIRTARTEIGALHSQIAEEEAKINNAMHAKELLFATGDRFCNAVASAFEELGINVVNGPYPRADILGFVGSTIAAIEAKGLEGAARERDLRQVDTWKAEVQLTLASSPTEREAHPILRGYASQLEELGVRADEGRTFECKGIMVIGTFRLTPLPDRNEENDFPGDLKSKITLSRVCALSGLQLYNLMMQARNDPNEKERIRRVVFETEGLLAVGKDWRAHLTKSD